MNTRSRTISLASLAGLLVFTGCGHSGGTSVPLRGGATLALQSVVIQPERTPVERMLDGTIEAVNQGTVAAQTAGRVEAVLYDVNDFVAAGAVIVRLRATEKRVGLRAAANAEEEALAPVSGRRGRPAGHRWKQLAGIRV